MKKWKYVIVAIVGMAVATEKEAEKQDGGNRRYFVCRYLFVQNLAGRNL